MKVLVIGRRLNVPVVAKSRGEAASPFRFLGALRPARQPDVQQVDSRTIGMQPNPVFPDSRHRPVELRRDPEGRLGAVGIVRTESEEERKNACFRHSCPRLIVQELITAGHQVLGLARSDAGAQPLSSPNVFYLFHS